MDPQITSISPDLRLSAATAAPAAASLSETEAGGDARGLGMRQDSFAGLLGKLKRSASQGTPEERAQETAREFVAMSMVQPMLAQLRNTNNAAAPFAPSSGEKQFQSMLDAHIAQEIVRAERFPLVDSVARKLLQSDQAKRGTPEASPNTTARSSHEDPQSPPAPAPAATATPAVQPPPEVGEAVGAGVNAPVGERRGRRLVR